MAPMGPHPSGTNESPHGTLTAATHIDVAGTSVARPTLWKPTRWWWTRRRCLTSTLPVRSLRRHLAPPPLLLSRTVPSPPASSISSLSSSFLLAPPPIASHLLLPSPPLSSPPHLSSHLTCGRCPLPCTSPSVRHPHRWRRRPAPIRWPRYRTTAPLPPLHTKPPYPPPIRWLGTAPLDLPIPLMAFRCSHVFSLCHCSGCVHDFDCIHCCAGAVLHDLLRCPRVPRVELDALFRQARDLITTKRSALFQRARADGSLA
jgi:hypothetical protein